MLDCTASTSPERAPHNALLGYISTHPRCTIHTTLNSPFPTHLPSTHHLIAPPPSCPTLSPKISCPLPPVMLHTQALALCKILSGIPVRSPCWFLTVTKPYVASIGNPFNVRQMDRIVSGDKGIMFGMLYMNV